MSGNDGGAGGNEVASLAVAIVALVVALVALVGTTAQVFQQYLATAVGYSNCGKRVMGPWARHTKLVFHPWELRFEVVFRSPDITVVTLRPDQAGSVNSMQSWDVEEPTLLRQPGLARENSRNGIADYSATWLDLLSTVHEMLRYGVPSPGFQGEMVSVEVQARLQTLDLMPEGVKKPYATTTLSSIVVLAAMLGLHWKQFDRKNDRYIADGNGLMFTGFAVPHLGIMFSFTCHGTPRFSPATRVVPSIGLLEYCFGFVPTILRPVDAPRPVYLTDVPRDLGTLRLGSPSGIASTLALLQCDKHIIESIGSSEHIFPVLFELVGMLGRPMHIRGIAGRTLPNPLPYRWDDKSFSPKRLLTAYVNRVLDGVAQSIGYGEVARTISSLKIFTSDPQFHLLPESDPKFLHNLHDMVDWCDDELLQWDSESRREILLVISTHIETFWGSLLKSQEPKLYDYSSNLHSAFRHLDKLDLEDRERGLVEIYFDTVYPRHRQDMGPPDKPSQQPWGILFNEKPKTAAIWPLLMLRMVCWLNLHTFHAADVQLPKVDLMGTQLPVYIS
ncbi:hypothetical protein F5144DRAFT_240588 [Chaetomium tenue]|uniref:Uncharacterized protein n=1 Tax=Chaetomium tenue TaxID=1854479 RepID=A0ACB7P7B6_9PEZI|nr:hypothetical protein F5144DRAFT_240588 [Chaetomium globosum]